MLDRTKKKLKLSESKDIVPDPQGVSESTLQGLEPGAHSEAGNLSETTTTSDSKREVSYTAFFNTALLCALGPSTLVDFGYDPVQCAAVSILVSAVFPVLVLRFVCKAEPQLCLQGWFFAIFEALIVTSLVGALQEGSFYRTMTTQFHLRVTIILFAICILVQMFLPWSVKKLWESFGKLVK